MKSSFTAYKEVIVDETAQEVARMKLYGRIYVIFKKYAISEDGQSIIFDGDMYKLSKCGYYACGGTGKGKGKGKALHRVIWQKYNGEIPPKHHIHHIDGNRKNNHIKNLQLLSASKHSRLHGTDPVQIKKIQKAVAKIRRSRRKKAVCTCCSKEFITSGTAVHKYCSDLCNKRMSKKRRKTKTLICCVCKKEFLVHPQTEQKYCDHRCAVKDQMNKNSVQKMCGFCGIKFNTGGNCNGKREQKYCTHKCMKEAWRQRQRDNGGKVT